jgi:hypothetical protein
MKHNYVLACYIVFLTIITYENMRSHYYYCGQSLREHYQFV